MNLVSSLLAWLPLLLIIAAAVLFGRYQMRSYNNHVARIEGINDTLIQLNRDMVTELREIKEILKDRK